MPAFWTGNGLSVAKILPESAIKFFTYETSVSDSSLGYNKSFFVILTFLTLFRGTRDVRLFRNDSLRNTGTM